VHGSRFFILAGLIAASGSIAFACSIDIRGLAVPTEGGGEGPAAAPGADPAVGDGAQASRDGATARDGTPSRDVGLQPRDDGAPSSDDDGAPSGDEGGAGVADATLDAETEDTIDGPISAFAGDGAPSVDAAQDVLASPEHGPVISIDFVGEGTPMAPAEVAGVAPAAFWNSATGPQGALTDLVANDGSTTSAIATWSADHAYSLRIPENTGDAHMINGYLDPFVLATLTVSGLPTFVADGYDVYVYADGEVPPGVERTAAYSIGAVSQNVTHVGNGVLFSGAFSPALARGTGNYLVFHGVQGPSFTLTAVPGETTHLPRAPLNGIQIVPTTSAP
jgi:hypothetical protein